MDKSLKFVLPSPNFNKHAQDVCKKPHYLTPSGMSLLPREKQPPPMYGKFGPTLPARYLHPNTFKDLESVPVDKLYPPEKQYCEPCEQELHSLEDLKRHRAQHDTCPVAGCLFKCHPSVMDKHVNALHTSGLFDKFKKLSTPEEIAAWREERRKRYPTLANVLLKQKAREQRQKRGERLESNNKRFGNVNDRKRAQPNSMDNKDNASEKRQKGDSKQNCGNKRNRKSKNNKKAKKHEFQSKVQTDVKQKNEMLEEGSESSCNGIKMFRGTSQLKNYNHFNEKKKETTNALLGLVGMYGSDDDESEANCTENEENAEKIQMVSVSENNNSNSVDSLLGNHTKIIKADAGTNEIDIPKENTKDVYSKSPVHHNSLLIVPLTENVNSIISEATESDACMLNRNSSDEAPDEIPIQRDMPNNPFKSDSNSKNIPSSTEPHTKLSKLFEKTPASKQQHLKKRKFGLDYRKTRLRKQNTLLEKLLESDIRHERNVLLQCVRYVCENNFFNIGQNKNHETLEKNKL